MAEIVTEDVRLHVEPEGDGDPVTVFAHGLTNSCKELAPLTPLLPGSKVRFCFRGHGHSSTPEAGYRFEDFARDLDAVAEAYGATRAVGTSLGAGAICNLLTREPRRFERLIFVLPAGLDRPMPDKTGFLRVAEILETHPVAEAIELILSDAESPDRGAEVTWLDDVSREMWADVNPIGVARAIRAIVDDFPIPDLELMRAVDAPTMIICREGDPIHPAIVGEILADLMPDAELHVYGDAASLVDAIPELVRRAIEVLS